MRRLLLRALPLIVALVALPAGAGAVDLARAADPVVIRGFVDLAVDEAHGQVFVSQGAGPLVVTDLAGTPTGVVPEVPTGSQLVLSDDGATLYVMRTAEHEIAAVDTATLAVTAYDLGDRCPRSAVVTGGLVWFAHRCSSDPYATAQLVALDPADGSVHDSDVLATDPALAASPARPGEVYVASGRITRYTVSTADATPTLVQVAQTEIDSANDMAFDVARDRLVISDEYTARRLSADTLARVGNSIGEGSVALRADGELALYDDGRGQTRLYHPGTGRPWRTYDPWRLWSEQLMPHGAAWGAERLYLVTGTKDAAGRPVRHVRAFVPRLPASVRVVARTPEIRSGDRARLQIELNTDAASRLVEIYRVAEGQSRRHVGTIQVPGREKVSFFVHPDRRTDYEVVYPGDETVDAATATDRVEVAAVLSIKVRNAAKTRGNTAFVRSGTAAVFVAKARAVAPDCITFRIEVQSEGAGYVNGGKTGCVPVDSTNRARFRLTSKKGGRYYQLRVTAVVTRNALNLGGSGLTHLQLCAGSVPCNEGG